MSKFFTFSSELPEAFMEARATSMAATVSEWLAAEEQTKSKTPEAIRAELVAGCGVLALDGETPVGYVAVRRFSMPGEVVRIMRNGQFYVDDIPHFGISSFVVSEEKRGCGIGGILLQNAQLAIRGLARRSCADYLDAPDLVMASAVAAPASQKLFEKSGFYMVDDAVVATAHGYPVGEPLPPGKRLMVGYVHMPVVD